MPVPPGVSAEQAVLIEPIACVLQGLRRAGGADAGVTAVVFGCGTLGLATIGVLASAGATVVAVDPSKRRRTTALRVGAEFVMDAAAGPDLRRSIREVIGVDGVDLIVEASGNPAAQAGTFSLTNRASRIVFLGLSHADATAVPLRMIQERDLRIHSSDGAEADIWGPALRLVRKSGLDLTPAISHVFTMREMEAAVAAARDPQIAGKVLVRPNAPSERPVRAEDCSRAR
nr:zinc-binding dehydrogenase [Kineococcus aurantiacus]